MPSVVLDGEQARIILYFLTICLEIAEKALESETPLDKALMSHPLIKGRMTYWANVGSAIKWLGYLATRGVFRDVSIDDHELNERVELWISGSMI